MNVRLRPERGLDVGDASYRGTRIAWLSSVGEVPWNGDWRASWGGGLVTTCGLDNVGRPSEGIGLHGTYSSLAAHQVVEEEGVVRGTIDDPRGLRVERTIEIGDDSLKVFDRTTNLAEGELEAPLLYHVNVGFWAEDVHIDSGEVVPRDDDAAPHDWSRIPEEADLPERVWEHVGATRARVRGSGLEVEIASSLPRMWQWVDPAIAAVGIEPANCSVLGRAHDRAEGRLPTLAPGETRETWLSITAREIR